MDELGLKEYQILKKLSGEQANAILYELTTYYNENGFDLQSLSEQIEMQKDAMDDISGGV